MGHWTPTGVEPKDYDDDDDDQNVIKSDFFQFSSFDRQRYIG